MRFRNNGMHRNYWYCHEIGKFKQMLAKRFSVTYKKTTKGLDEGKNTTGNSKTGVLVFFVFYKRKISN